MPGFIIRKLIYAQGWNDTNTSIIHTAMCIICITIIPYLSRCTGTEKSFGITVCGYIPNSTYVASGPAVPSVPAGKTLYKVLAGVFSGLNNNVVYLICKIKGLII